MATVEKEKVIQEMTDKFSRATGIYLVDFSGMNVNTTNDLRRNFRESRIEYRVLKNTLAKISFDKAGIQGMEEFLYGVNAYAISYDDPTLPVKILDKNKEFKDKLKFKGALFEGRVVKGDQVEKLSKLPTRMEMLGQLVGMLNSPMVKLVGTLNGAMAGLVNALKAVENKKK